MTITGVAGNPDRGLFITNIFKDACLTLKAIRGCHGDRIFVNTASHICFVLYCFGFFFSICHLKYTAECFTKLKNCFLRVSSFKAYSFSRTIYAMADKATARIEF